MLDTLITLYNLPAVYDIPDTAWTDLRKELLENLEVTYEREGNYTITVWHKDKTLAAEMANTIPNILNKFTTEINQTEARINRQVLERRYQLTNERLNQVADSLKIFSKRYKIFSPEEQARAASTAIADLRYELVRQEIAVEMSAALLGASDPKTQAQQQLLKELQKKSDEVSSKPGFVGDFSVDNSADVVVDYARLLADVEVFTKLKAFLIPSLEQARLDEERVVPELLVLDPAVPADKKSRPKRSLIVAGSTLGVFFLMSGFVLLRYRVRLAKRKWQHLLASK
jgi:capsule polysaccharide export protein KpsE/RkpR